MISQAYFSEDRAHRYWLMREWDAALPVLCVIGVNPSTADEKKNDATIRKDIGFADRLGFGSLLKLNIGAFRSTDPRLWRKASDPIGPENYPHHLSEYARKFNASKVVAAWGKNGNYAPSQCELVVKAFPELWCWGRNSDGTPRHPLMLSYSTPLEIFTSSNGRS